MEQEPVKYDNPEMDMIEGAEIMELAGITAMDLELPDRMNKIQDIVRFFSGKEDKRALIRGLLAGKSVDSVNHLYEYSKLRTELSSLSKRAEEITNELKYFEV